jgi:hypothetical protein
MATNVPLLLDGKQEQPVTPGQHACSMTLYVLNIVGPLLYGVFGGILRDVILTTDKDAGAWILVGFASSLILVSLLVTFSGIVLIKSVFSIRTYFKEKEAMDYINIAMLMRHAAAYGLFMIGCVAYLMSQLIWSLRPSQATYIWVARTGVVFNTVLFLQQVLLARIYWDLGNAAKKPT